MQIRKTGILVLVAMLAAAQSCRMDVVTSPKAPTALPRGLEHSLGQNFWNIMWEGWPDFFKPGVDWTEPGDPWNPALLADLAPFTGPLRFMDLDAINDNPIMHWSDRAPGDANLYDLATYGVGKTIPIDSSIARYYPDNSSGAYAYYGLPYEWMIDLCNRAGRDLWVCIPTFADDDYAAKLAALIRVKLDSSLRCFVEYSNESWNGMFRVNDYCLDQGPALGFPGENKYYQGAGFATFRSLRVFKIFQDAFGAAVGGSRLVRVLSFSGDFDLADKSIENVVYSGRSPDGTLNKAFNPKWNPAGQTPDILAIAPYIGPYDAAAGGTSAIDGSDTDIAARFRANVDWNYENYVRPAVAIAARYGWPIGCYEGGQQLDTGAGAWNSNPEIYGEYLHMLDVWKSAGLDFFCNYTLYGSYGAGSAWGARDSASSPPGLSYKYKALSDWLRSNP